MAYYGQERHAVPALLLYVMTAGPHFADIAKFAANNSVSLLCLTVCLTDSKVRLF